MDNDVVHVYNEILLSHLKKIPFAKTEMDLESIMLRIIRKHPNFTGKKIQTDI